MSCALRRSTSGIIWRHQVAASFIPVVSSHQPALATRHHQRRNFAKKGDADAVALRKTVIRKKQQPAANQAEESRESRQYKLVKDCLDAKPTGAPEAAKEEMERRHNIGRNYVIGNFERHNEENHDLACKIKLKLHAIKMLPKGSPIKEAALEIDDEGPPAWRHIPVWTPPIPGFDPQEFMDTGDH